jgi:hypothetical protein
MSANVADQCGCRSIFTRNGATLRGQGVTTDDILDMVLHGWAHEIAIEPAQPQEAIKPGMQMKTKAIQANGPYPDKPTQLQEVKKPIRRIRRTIQTFTDPRLLQTILSTGIHNMPFHYAAIQPQWRETCMAGMTDEWLKTMHGTRLYSGGMPASYGPPSSLKLVGLGYEIEDQVGGPSTAPAPPSNEGAAAANIPAAASQSMASSAVWKALVRQFRLAPSASTYLALANSEVAMTAFYEMNGEAKYKMGSKKIKQTSIIRYAMLGEGKKKTYQEYAKLVEEVADPKGDDYFLVLIYRMRGLIRQAGDGGSVFAQ